jgi:hypothetical protein
MICPCGRLIKKRTLTDGVKSLAGELLLYTHEGDRFIKECCFQTLVPSLYTFINRDWFLQGTMLLIDKTSEPEVIMAYRVSPELLTAIYNCSGASTTEPLRVVEVTTGVSALADRHAKTADALLKAHRTVIRLEKDMKGIQYKYSSLAYDNECLSKQLKIFLDRSGTRDRKAAKNLEESELMKHHDRIDSSKIVSKCNLCEAFPTIKEDLKLLKAESHEQISKIKFEHAVDKQQLTELLQENGQMREEISRLKEENRLLRTAANIDHGDHFLRQ